MLSVDSLIGKPSQHARFLGFTVAIATGDIGTIPFRGDKVRKAQPFGKTRSVKTESSGGDHQAGICLAILFQQAERVGHEAGILDPRLCISIP